MFVSPTKVSQGIWPWRPLGFDYKTTSIGLGKTETPVLEGTSKILQAPRSRGKEQWLHRKLYKNCLLVMEGLLWRHGLAGPHHRDEGTGSCCLGRPPLASPLLEVDINHRAYRPKGWAASGEKTTPPISR